jgi:hypothetical protein
MSSTMRVCPTLLGLAVVAPTCDAIGLTINAEPETTSPAINAEASVFSVPRLANYGRPQVSENNRGLSTNHPTSLTFYGPFRSVMAASREHQTQPDNRGGINGSCSHAL